MNTTVRKLVAATGLAFAASFAQAAPQPTFDFSVDVKWVDAKFSNESQGFGGITNGDHVVQWGAPSSYIVDYHNVNADPYYARSALEISNSPVGGSLYTNSSSVNVNMFTHYNSTMSSNYKSLESATLEVSVKLIYQDGTVAKDFGAQKFYVHFLETPNIGGNCAWGACDSDIFAVTTDMDFKSTFYLADGYEYTLNYFEPSNVINPLSQIACREAGIPSVVPNCYGFMTTEKGITTAQFALSVTAVPEPETYAMLLAGLGIIGVVARRRRNMR
jgi:hypothetical protein